MSERPFMQLYVSDYLGDTRHLSCEQHGAYLLILMTMWNAGGSLPNDDAKLSRIVCLSVKKWRAIKEDILSFFDVSDALISHHRLTNELQKSERKSELRASAGAIGGKAKALKDKDQRLANAIPEPCHSPDTIKIKETSDDVSKKTKRGSRLSDDFIPDLSEAGRLGLPEQDARREADKFRDYWRGQPGQRGVKLDWPATWRNWCRSAVERKRPRRVDPPPKPRNIGDAIRDEARRLGVLRDEPDSQERGIHGESQPAGNVRVLDLAFKPSLKGFG